MFEHFFLVPVLSNVIALAPWPLSALRTLNSLLRKVRHVPPCRYGPLLSACRQRAGTLAIEPPFHPSRARDYGDGLGCAERGQRRASTPKNHR